MTTLRCVASCCLSDDAFVFVKRLQAVYKTHAWDENTAMRCVVLCCLSDDAFVFVKRLQAVYKTHAWDENTAMRCVDVCWLSDDAFVFVKSLQAVSKTHAWDDNMDAMRCSLLVEWWGFCICKSLQALTKPHAWEMTTLRSDALLSVGWDENTAMRCQSTESPILFRSYRLETPFSDQKWASKIGDSVLCAAMRCVTCVLLFEWWCFCNKFVFVKSLQALPKHTHGMTPVNTPPLTRPFNTPL